MHKTVMFVRVVKLSHGKIAELLEKEKMVTDISRMASTLVLVMRVK